MSVCTAPAQCYGTTRSGHRCSITSRSTMRDSVGRFVADPLRKGGAFCMLHTVLFCTAPAHAGESSIIAYVYLETSSLDVYSGRIVEIGALIHGSRCMFSTVVPRAQTILRMKLPSMAFRTMSCCRGRASQGHSRGLKPSCGTLRSASWIPTATPMTTRAPLQQ